MSDVIPFLLSAFLSYSVYSFLDKRYLLTRKVSKHIKVADKWKNSIIAISLFMAIILIGVARIYIFELSELEYDILSGILTGIIMVISCEMNKSRSRIKM